MEEFFEPTYIPDFCDESTRKRIRSAKHGEAVSVKVRLTDNSEAARIDAVGTRSEDGKRFDVRLMVDNRFQDIQYNYDEILDLADNRGKS